MELKKIAVKLGWEMLTDIPIGTFMVKEGYTGDLLSDVLANASPGSVWLTIQKHKNILGVASAKDLTAVVLCGNNKPEEDLIKIAEIRNLPLFLTDDDTFVAGGKLYKLLEKK